MTNHDANRSLKSKAYIFVDDDSCQDDRERYCSVFFKWLFVERVDLQSKKSTEMQNFVIEAWSSNNCLPSWIFECKRVSCSFWQQLDQSVGICSCSSPWQIYQVQLELRRSWSFDLFSASFHLFNSNKSKWNFKRDCSKGSMYKLEETLHHFRLSFHIDWVYILIPWDEWKWWDCWFLRS